MAVPSRHPAVRTLVAGVDSSTQSCKVLVCDAATGEVVREGRADHPDGTAVHPDAWWAALELAAERAGGLDDVAAISVGGQQHGLVALDRHGEVVREALLWNDTRSAGAARDLVADLGGGAAWATAVGSVPVASLTISKLRWLADAEPDNAARTAAVCLPHDWLTWKLQGATVQHDGPFDALVTDRSDASGTGWFDPVSNEYRRDLVALALRDEGAARRLALPRVLGPHESAGRARLVAPGAVVGPGCGDNAGAALGLGLDPGATSVSLGTSGVVAAVSARPTHDASGLVTGFADASGAFLPLACTLNGSRVLDHVCALLGVTHDELSDLALAASPGADGLVLVPWFDGERTPNLPTATASLHGMTLASTTRENYARAAVEGVLCLMGAGIEAVRAQGVDVDRVSLIGGGAKSRAVRQLAPEVLGVPVELPPTAEYVALGAARQGAWVLSGQDQAPRWTLPGTITLTPDDEALERGTSVRARYARFAGQQAGLVEV